MLLVVVVDDVIQRLHEESRHIAVEFVIFCEICNLTRVNCEYIIFLKKLLLFIVVGFLVAKADETRCAFLLVEDLIDFASVVVVLRRRVFLVELRMDFHKDTEVRQVSSEMHISTR